MSSFLGVSTTPPNNEDLGTTVSGTVYLRAANVLKIRKTKGTLRTVIP